MKRISYLRITTLASIMCAALSAQATSLFLSSAGLATSSGTTEVVSETVNTQYGGYGPLSSLNYSFDTGTLVGSGIYSGTGGTLDFSIKYNASSIVVVGPSQSMDGTWTYTNGTGTYAGLVGGGTEAHTLLTLGPSLAVSGTVLSGTLNPVPEPEAYAALGIGLLGFLVKRKNR